jgi:hypothetical protein
MVASPDVHCACAQLGRLLHARAPGPDLLRPSSGTERSRRDRPKWRRDQILWCTVVSGRGKDLISGVMLAQEDDQALALRQSPQLISNTRERRDLLRTPVARFKAR